MILYHVTNTSDHWPWNKKGKEMNDQVNTEQAVQLERQKEVKAAEVAVEAAQEEKAPFEEPHNVM